MSRKKASPKSSSTRNFSKADREYWESLTWSDITDLFGTKTTGRGRDYVRSGQVKSLWTTDDGKKLLGVVQGTEEYLTLVSLEKRRNRLVPASSCSCPVGSACKHGVALIGTFLEVLGQNKPILPCKELPDGSWETMSPNGKTTILAIDLEDEFDDDDDDDFWDEEDDDWEEDFLPRKRIRRTVKSSAKDPAWNPETLRRKLTAKTPEELSDLILQLAEDHPVVRKQFEQELFVESASKSGKADKIVQKAVEMIDQGVDRGNFFDCDYYGHGGPSVDLDSVTELVRQFKQIGDPLPGLARISEHLLEEGGRFLEDTGAEDDIEFRDVFDVVAKILLASKSDPVQIVLWSYKMNDLDQYAMADDLGETIRKHPWPGKVWAEVADRLVADMKKKPASKRHFTELRRCIESLDQAKRQEEATELLRKEAPKIGDYHELADRLIEVGSYEEAEKLATRQLKKELDKKSPENYKTIPWRDRLGKIADRRKDWPTLVSIQASEFFHSPGRGSIRSLLGTAKKIKVEPAIRQAIHGFLETGELPMAVASVLSGKKPSPAAKKAWPIPVFFFQPKPIQAGPRYDVLCKWAMMENRPGDVIRWFDQLKSRPALKRNIDVIDVAEAVSNSHPDRAFEIYRKAAEEEMDTTSTNHYPIAVSHLVKARRALEKAKRGREWAKIMEDIRARHRRKSSLMKQLDELEAGSIVQQKRQGK